MEAYLRRIFIIGAACSFLLIGTFVWKLGDIQGARLAVPERFSQVTEEVHLPDRAPLAPIEHGEVRTLVFGDVVDELHGVKIYYNGAVSTTRGRHRSPDGYNYGLKYQCVEFVKRYYFEKLAHRMPHTWGHARDFYDSNVQDGEMNSERGLLQFKNGGSTRPKPDDLLVFAPTQWNHYGHVAIVSEVFEDQIEIAQQNPGPQGESRVYLPLILKNGKWHLGGGRIQGWLRLQ